ncbi:MAG TPA: hypothetical protein VHF65_03430 [Nitrososphaera sp.]|jgi:hypothetical protein|nr:hypothetical protein [Nitrososphaera sp.]
MTPVKSNAEIEEAAKKAIIALYGSDVKDFKVRVVLPYASEELIAKGGLPTEERRDSWDVQVIFLLNETQYTVDLIIQEKDGQITYSRLIDKMNPI